MLNAINYNPNSSFNLSGGARSTPNAYKTVTPTYLSSTSTNNKLSFDLKREALNSDYQKNQTNNRNRFFTSSANEKQFSTNDSQNNKSPSQLIRRSANYDLLKVNREQHQPSDHNPSLSYKEDRFKEKEQSKRYEHSNYELLPNKSQLNRNSLYDKYRNENKEEIRNLRSNVAQDYARSSFNQSPKRNNINSLKEEQADYRDEIRYEVPRMSNTNQTNRINRDYLLRMKRKYKQKISANVSGTKFEIG
jgi:hypothetical protein